MNSASASAMELIAIIKEGIFTQPRNTQRMIGPSEIGVECDRRLGYKWAGTAESNPQSVAWKPYVGTALHAQFAEIFESTEQLRQRYLVENKVTVGTVAKQDITGTCDLFDIASGTVWDWKFTTKNKIVRDYRSKGPGEQYRIQAHLYGKGYVNAGFDVHNVGVFFFTRDGDFTDRYDWSEPFDISIADAALARMDGIATSIDSLGDDFVLPQLATAKAFCNFCPYFKRDSTDFSQACNGHGEEMKVKTLEEMIGA